MAKKKFWYGGIFENDEGEVYVVLAEKKEKVKKHGKKDELILIKKGESLIEALRNLKKECKKKGLNLPQSCC